MTTGTMSSILGGGGTLPGQAALMQNAPTSVSFNGQEFLRIGSVKTYAADHAASLAIAPQLRVFGTLANSYGTTNTGGDTCQYAYVGTNYVSANSNVGSLFYAASLSALSSTPATSTGTGGAISSKTPLTGGNARIGQGNGYLVVPNGANVAMAYTTNGSTYNPVGGNFATFLDQNATCYCGALGWISLHSLAGWGPGSRGYIANTNPTGTWTVDSANNLGMTTCHSIASNGTVIVAVGGSGAATAGKIATATAVSGTFTDRTSASGITFTVAEAVFKVVWTGARFVALTTLNQIITSTDGINWVVTEFAFETSTVNPVGTGTQSVYGVGDMASDGAGKVVFVDSATQPSASHPLIRVSTDHGLSFTTAQLFLGKHVQGGTPNCRTVSYANGKFILNLSGALSNFVDCNSIATPNYVGQQIQFAQGFSVRIK